MINLPHTKEQQNEFIKLHKQAKQLVDKKQRRKTTHDIHEKIMLYKSVEYYNQDSKNICKFSNSDETEECCERNIKQSLKHYMIYGNCCKSCSNYFNTKLRLVH